MSWKNLKQQSLADALIVEHAAVTELDDAHDLIDWSRFERKLKTIHLGGNFFIQKGAFVAWLFHPYIG